VIGNIDVVEGKDVLEDVLGGVGGVALASFDVGAEDDVLGCEGVLVDVDVVGLDVRKLLRGRKWGEFSILRLLIALVAKDRCSPRARSAHGG